MTQKTKRPEAPIGSISCGVKRPEDIVPAFLDELESLDKERHDRYCRELIDERSRYGSSFEVEEIINELFEILNNYAPPYCYFGANHGEGADYGFWISEDLGELFDGLRVSDTSEIPDDYMGEAIYINDHGNMTLYSCNKGKLTEIWSVV